MDLRTNWLLLINAALGSFLAGTASRIFAVSMPTVASSLDTTIVGISWAVISFQVSTISFADIRPYWGHLRPGEDLRAWVCRFRYRCMSMRPLPKRLPTHRVSIFPGDWRFHDTISSASAGDGFDAERIRRKGSGFHDDRFSLGSSRGSERRRTHHRLRSLASGFFLSPAHRSGRNDPHVAQLETRKQVQCFRGRADVHRLSRSFVARVGDSRFDRDHRPQDYGNRGHRVAHRYHCAFCRLVGRILLSRMDGPEPDSRSGPISDSYVYSERSQSPSSGCGPSDGWFCAAVLPAGYPAFVPLVYGFIVYQRTRFHGDVVPCCRLDRR